MLNGLEVIATEVEVGFSRGIPGVVIVGLPDNAVKESRERLKLAMTQSNFEYPSAMKIVVNLSPADVRKEGSALDLPIAVGILRNKYRLQSRVFQDHLFFGELNLNGDLNPVKGVLNFSLFARQRGFRGIIIPFANRQEGAFVKEIDVYPLKNLSEVVRFIQNPDDFAPFHCQPPEPNDGRAEDDFCEVKGQYLAKRAMEIAAAGFHNVLMMGPPGAGKSMISKSLPSILPDMDDDEILETSLIYSVAGLLGDNRGLVVQRPFRSPHHTISDVGISGGGKFPIPGEISLAHNGVLFLDELPFFKKSAIEVLRQPLEDGKITISRSLTSFTFPARFMLVVAMNPIEDSVGFGSGGGFHCSEAQKRAYYSKLSRPLLDRIDLQVEVRKVKFEEITAHAGGETSEAIKKRVIHAREIQRRRFRDLKKQIFANGQMKNNEIKKFCSLDAAENELIKTAVERFDLSARGYFKLLKVSRTIADLEGSDKIGMSHLQEALQYRMLDLSRF